MVSYVMDGLSRRTLTDLNILIVIAFIHDDGARVRQQHPHGRTWQPSTSTIKFAQEPPSLHNTTDIFRTRQ
jgi:hypothetical protein